MALRADATLEAFILRMAKNKDIAKILNIPLIEEKDSDKVKLQKRKLIIDKTFSKTAQVPVELGKSVPTVNIEGKEYKNYADTRITASFVQSIPLHSDLFGNPQIDICIYYDNTKVGDTFKLLDLISDEFSGQNLNVEAGENKEIIRNLRCEGITSQTAIINNYERVGIRFSFFATVYKN